MASLFFPDTIYLSLLNTFLTIRPLYEKNICVLGVSDNGNNVVCPN